MDNYLDYNFYEDVFLARIQFLCDIFKHDNGKSLAKICLNTAITRLKVINGIHGIKYQPLFNEDELLEYLEIKLYSALVYYCYNLSFDKKQSYETIIKENMQESIEYLFSKEKFSLIQESKKFGLDNTLMKNQNIKILTKDSYNFSFVDTDSNYPIYIESKNNWKNRRSLKKICSKEYACFLVKVRENLLDDDVSEGISTLRNYFFEATTNLSLITYISKKIIDIEKRSKKNKNLKEDYLIEALVSIAHIDIVHFRERYVDYIIDKKIETKKDVQNIWKEISYICDFALPFIVDYSFNLIKLVADKNYIYKLVENIKIEKRVQSVPSIIFKKDVLKEYVKRKDYSPYYCFDLYSYINEINTKYYNEKINLDTIISKVVDEWYKISKRPILLEKKEVIKHFKNRVMFNNMMQLDEKISIHSAAQELFNRKDQL